MYLFTYLNTYRDTYVKTESGESPNDRNDRGMFLLIKHNDNGFCIFSVNL